MSFMLRVVEIFRVAYLRSPVICKDVSNKWFSRTFRWCGCRRRVYVCKRKPSRGESALVAWALPGAR
jgi:hypothetical protein